jgi:RNA polymerase sigma factor (TIGR02999 family)
MSPTPDVTMLLEELSGGDRSALDELVPIVYDDLRNLAHRQLRRERADHTLDTTALVHEAYVKLARVERLTLKDRSHFFAVCAQAMRRILVNYARDRSRLKRGGASVHLPIEDVVVAARERPDDLLLADQAISRLEELNERHARVVEYRVFGGMSVEETADVLGVSEATVKRDWASARAWLNRELAPRDTRR